VSSFLTAHQHIVIAACYITNTYLLLTIYPTVAHALCCIGAKIYGIWCAVDKAAFCVQTHMHFWQQMSCATFK